MILVTCRLSYIPVCQGHRWDGTRAPSGTGLKQGSTQHLVPGKWHAMSCRAPEPDKASMETPWGPHRSRPAQREGSGGALSEQADRSRARRGFLGFSGDTEAAAPTSSTATHRHFLTRLPSPTSPGSPRLTVRLSRCGSVVSTWVPISASPAFRRPCYLGCVPRRLVSTVICTPPLLLHAVLGRSALPAFFLTSVLSIILLFFVSWMLRGALSLPHLSIPSVLFMCRSFFCAYRNWQLNCTRHPRSWADCPVLLYTDIY